MADHSIDIYFFPASPPSRAALMVIKALGLKHNINIVNIIQKDHLKPEFIKMNPMHTIPVINDKGFILWDSHVIIKYLATQYAKDDSLYPKDPKKNAIVDQRLFFEATTLFPRFVEYAAPVLFKAQKPDQEKKQKLEEALEILNGFLDNQTWMAGQYMTIADFSIITVIATLEATGQFDLNKYGNISAWYTRSKSAMAGFGYDEVNQQGANAYGGLFKSQLSAAMAS